MPLGWLDGALLAALSVAAVGFLRFLLDPILDERAPLLIFTLAVMLSSWYGGWRAGIVSLALSAMAGSFLFIEQHGHRLFANPAEQVRMGIFVATSATIVYLNHALRVLRRHALGDAENLRRANERLEEAVQQRTMELQEAIRSLQVVNDELEGFSYTVSHDLRAPLRALSADLAMFREEMQTTPTPDQQRAFDTMRTHIRRMSQLIDDLMTLSRATRGDLLRVPVDLSAIAEQSLREVQLRHPRPTAEFRVEPGLMADADPRLIPMLIDNLVRNAWKFSRNSSPSRVEFGSLSLEGEQVFFVRDNGVGFDMTYHDKLFEPFQRLHTEREFEGSGVGLATCKRIALRHGGRIWASSEPGQGATFYFTLGNRPVGDAPEDTKRLATAQ